MTTQPATHCGRRNAQGPFSYADLADPHQSRFDFGRQCGGEDPTAAPGASAADRLQQRIVYIQPSVANTTQDNAVLIAGPHGATTNAVKSPLVPAYRSIQKRPTATLFDMV
jgi:hypothetical protein